MGLRSSLRLQNGTKGSTSQGSCEEQINWCLWKGFVMLSAGSVWGHRGVAIVPASSKDSLLQRLHCQFSLLEKRARAQRGAHKAAPCSVLSNRAKSETTPASVNREVVK